MRVLSLLMICAVAICLMFGVTLSTLSALASTIETTVNINPETLNLKAGGKWITAYIELHDDFDVSDIDISTVLLDNVIPAESNSKYGFVKNPEIKDRDGNGIPELMVKFDKHAVTSHVIDKLYHMMPIPKRGEEVELTITGSLIDGTPFEGSDTVRAIYPA